MVCLLYLTNSATKKFQDKVSVTNFLTCSSFSIVQIESYIKSWYSILVAFVINRILNNQSEPSFKKFVEFSWNRYLCKKGNVSIDLCLAYSVGYAY